MGLDMYLTKEVYIGANYEHRKMTGNIEIYENGKLIPIKFETVSEIILQVGYWRKANAIHKWFVDNVQDGVDECQRSYVSKDDLQSLLDVCKKVKNDNSLASGLLPAQSGFFFGGTDYDEWYYADLDHTIEVLEGALEDGGNFYYQASW